MGFRRSGDCHLTQKPADVNLESRVPELLEKPVVSRSPHAEVDIKSHSLSQHVDSSELIGGAFFLWSRGRARTLT